MKFSSNQVDTITASVLRELRSRGVTVAAGRSTSPTPTARPSLRTSSESLTDHVGLKEKVVTEDSLIAANAAGRQISIPAGAIITPSGHDYIRRNGVVITSSVAGKQSTGTETGTVVIVGDCSAAKSTAGTAGWQIISAGCERDAAAQSRKLLSQPIVCCGGEASITACLLNRNRDIRAAVVGAATDVSRLTAAMQPNVLCLESAWAFSQLLKLLRGFSGSQTKPASWKELA